MGYGIDFDKGQVECRTCGEIITPDDRACACCDHCGGVGSLETGLGAGKGTKRITCGACGGTGRAAGEGEQAESEAA